MAYLRINTEIAKMLLRHGENVPCALGVKIGIQTEDKLEFITIEEIDKTCDKVVVEFEDGKQQIMSLKYLISVIEIHSEMDARIIVN
jgi:hypothetical protein